MQTEMGDQSLPSRDRFGTFGLLPTLVVLTWIDVNVIILGIFSHRLPLHHACPY